MHLSWNDTKVYENYLKFCKFLEKVEMAFYFGAKTSPDRSDLIILPYKQLFKGTAIG